jgi:hypothetical protein
LKKTNFNYMCFLTLLPLKGDVHKVITLWGHSTKGAHARPGPSSITNT